MRVAVLGTGMVGQAIAERLAELGHDVVVGTRDVDATAARLPGLPLATFADAAGGADLVVNATPGDVALEVLAQTGAEALAGKVLIDISNPLDHSQGFPPPLFVSNTDSLGEQIQAAFPDTRVVKALNTVTAPLMVRPAELGGGEHSVFVCGNDADAKREVVALLASFGHTDVVDLGDITSARATEMYLPLWLRLMGALGTPVFSIKVVR